MVAEKGRSKEGTLRVPKGRDFMWVEEQADGTKKVDQCSRQLRRRGT
jgi:hypothetical protein